MSESRDKVPDGNVSRVGASGGWCGDRNLKLVTRNETTYGREPVVPAPILRHQPTTCAHAETSFTYPCVVPRARCRLRVKGTNYEPVRRRRLHFRVPCLGWMRQRKLDLYDSTTAPVRDAVHQERHQSLVSPRHGGETRHGRDHQVLGQLEVDRRGSHARRPGQGRLRLLRIDQEPDG